MANLQENGVSSLYAKELYASKNHFNIYQFFPTDGLNSHLEIVTVKKTLTKEKEIFTIIYVCYNECDIRMNYILIKSIASPLKDKKCAQVND